MVDEPFSRFEKPRVAPSTEATPTRFLYLSGVGHGLGTDEQALIDLFSAHGELDDPPVEMVPDKRFCFIIYKEVDSAVTAKRELGNKAIPSMNDIQFIIRYAVERIVSVMPEPEDSIPSSEVSLPGLTVIEEFISEEKERAILSGVCCEENPVWEQALNRRVQVSYGINLVLITFVLIHVCYIF